jgi:predicted ATPase
MSSECITSTGRPYVPILLICHWNMSCEDMAKTVTTQATAQATLRIAPHDRRVRVFVSSTLGELAPEREAARAAITRLRLTPVMFELGARPHPPRELYRSYLAQSDVFVGIYGERYGWVAPGSDVSGLEDEYLLSGDRPKLLYIKTPAPEREPRLTALIERIWTGSGVSTTPYRDAAQLEQLLADDLAVLLTERFDATARPSAQGLEPAPLPIPATPIVGREREIESVLQVLADPAARLVTLLGPGGIGKTRLALEIASRSGGQVTAFVDLAPLADPGLVPGAIAGALGVRAEGNRPVLDVLTDRIGGHPVLLVLDNFEHVLEAAPTVGRLLAACPRVQALVTSRSVLHLRGEHEVALAPLDPAPTVEVFVQRARQVREDFALDASNRAAVMQIVDRLEGIPLAIELAAARVRLLAPEALAQRLDRRLDLRSQEVDRPSRQQTLRATIGWSYALLNRDERALLRRLSVFARGWSLEAAEAVGAADDELDVLETLSALVGHSLVNPDSRSRSEPRFRMFETVREFARERLAESGELEATMRRLADYLCGFTARAGEALAHGDGRVWVRRIDEDVHTLRAAVAWAVEQDDAALAIRLTAPLARYWWSRGLLGQMLDLSERVAVLPSAAGLPPTEAALLLWTRGTIRVDLGRSREALPLLENVLAAARAADDRRLLAQSLFSLALATSASGEASAPGPAEQVRAMLEESVRRFREVGDDWGVALALIPLGDVALLDGDVASARAMHEEVLAHALTIDDDHMTAQAHDQLALDAMLSLDSASARRHLRSAAALYRSLHDHEGMAYCLEGFAGLALATERPELGARLLGAAARSRELVGVVVWPFIRPLHDRFEGFVRAAVPAATFDSAFAEGRGLEPEAALDLAVRETAQPDDVSAEAAPGSP